MSRNVWAVAALCIRVREGRSTSSVVLGNLSQGDTVEELELSGNRLRFSLVTGSGPKAGWVSLRADGRELMVLRSFKEVPLWSFRMRGTWVAMEPDVARKFEELYKQWQQGAALQQLGAQFGGFSYALDFSKMEQQNLQTGKVRSLQRDEKQTGQCSQRAWQTLTRVHAEGNSIHTEEWRSEAPVQLLHPCNKQGASTTRPEVAAPGCTREQLARQCAELETEVLDLKQKLHLANEGVQAHISNKLILESRLQQLQVQYNSDMNRLKQDYAALQAKHEESLVRLEKLEQKAHHDNAYLLKKIESWLGIEVPWDRTDNQLVQASADVLSQLREKGYPSRWKQNVEEAEALEDDLEKKERELSKELIVGYYRPTIKLQELKNEKILAWQKLKAFKDTISFDQYTQARESCREIQKLLEQESFTKKLLNPWVPIKEDRQPIKKGSRIFSFVHCLMMRSLTHHRLHYRSEEFCDLAQYEVMEITQCSNPELSSRYKFEHLKLTQKHPQGVDLPEGIHALELDRRVGELVLFHGCSAEVVANIMKQGFDFRIAGSNAGSMFGKGAYFAENASKSDLYSTPDQDGMRHMIVAKVLVGQPCVLASPDIHLCRPPPLPSSTCRDGVHGDGLYDSVMGEMRIKGGCVDHREFVTFHQNRAVPVAVVKYRHKSHCRCNLCRRQDS